MIGVVAKTSDSYFKILPLIVFTAKVAGDYRQVKSWQNLEIIIGGFSNHSNYAYILAVITKNDYECPPSSSISVSGYKRNTQGFNTPNCK